MAKEHISRRWPRWRMEEEKEKRSPYESGNYRAKDMNSCKQHLFSASLSDRVISKSRLNIHEHEKTKIYQLQEEVIQLKAKIARLTDELNTAEDCRRTRDQELMVLTRANVDLKEEIQMLTMQLEKKNRERYKFKQVICQLQEEVTQLKSEIGSLRLTDELNRLNRELLTVEDNERKRDWELMTYDRTKSNLEKEIEILTTDLENAWQIMTRKEKEMERLKSEIRFDKEISRLQQEKAEVIRELSNVKSTLRHQTCNIRTIREEKLQLEDKNADLKEEVDYLELVIRQLKMEKQTLAREYEKERAERQANLRSNWTEASVNCNKEIRALQCKNEVLKTELKQKEDMLKKNEEKSASKVKEQEREIESLKKAVSVLRRKVDYIQNEEESTDLNGEVQRLLQEKQQFITEKKKLNESARQMGLELQSMNTKLQNTVDKHKQEVEKLEDKIQTLMVEKRQHFTDLETSVGASQKTEIRLQRMNINVPFTVDKQRQEIVGLSEKMQQLLRENQLLTREMEYTKELTKKRETEHVSLKTKVQNQNKEIVSLKMQIEELNRRLQEANRKPSYKCFDDQGLQQRLDHANKRLKALQEELDVTKSTADKQKQERKELEGKIQSLMKQQHFTDLKTSVGASQKTETDLQLMNNSLQTTVDKQRQEIVGLNDKMQQLLRENQLLTRELEYNKELAQKRETEHDSLKTKVQNQNKEIVSLKMQTEELNRRFQEASRKPSHKGFDDQGLQQRLDDANKRIRALQEELDDTKSRLSRAIGDKLTDNNPNIADLSDKNRPTKLSERYQELYDNQWTDAFEVIEKTCVNEEEAIQKLKAILTETTAFCKRNAEDQMCRIKDDFSKGQDIPANIMKPLKDCRKAVAELYGKATFEDYLRGLCSKYPETAATLRTISPFIRECYEICWLMAVQDPPVAFGPEVPPNGRFDKDCYKAYTRNGERVEFVVWPVLLLHQGGPVLCKGVAQGFLS